MSTAATQPARGFGNLPCPMCGETGTIAVDLDDLTTFRCASCDDSFDRVHIEALIAQWQCVLAWLDTAPVREEGQP